MNATDYPWGMPELIDAWLAARRAGADEVARRHYSALSRALGVDLNAEPDEPPASPPELEEYAAGLRVGFRGSATRSWVREAHELMKRAADCRERLASPFDGYIETPSVVVVANSVHGAPIHAAVSQGREAHDELLVTLAGWLYPEANGRRVRDADLARHDTPEDP